MTNQHDGSFTQAMMDMAARREGVSSAELATQFNRTVHWASTFLGRLVKTKGIVVAKTGHRTGRYFVRQSDADAWLSKATRPQPHKYMKKALVITNAPVYVSLGTPPALLPGEMVIPEGVKVQRCPGYVPRNQVVSLLTDRPPIIRKGGHDFLALKSRGF